MAKPPYTAPRVPQNDEVPRRRRIWPWAALGVAILLVIIVAVSSSSNSGQVSGAPQTPAPAPTSKPADAATWGQTYAWPSGVSVQVSVPKAFTPSRLAGAATTDRAVVVSTTVRNAGDKPYEFNWMIFGPVATFDGQNAQTIIDVGAKVGGAPLTTILPGKSFTYQTAFGVSKAPGELQLQFQETFGSPTAIFIGPA